VASLSYTKCAEHDVEDGGGGYFAGDFTEGVEGGAEKWGRKVEGCAGFRQVDGLLEGRASF
jgi:hypothetical protein